MPPAITAFAHAKINLFLHVVGRRPDGYHLIESLVAFAEPHDVVSVSPADGLRLSVDGPFADELDGPAEDNLVHRAATALRSAHAVSHGAEIRLTKNLPVASGIGGGSADAAATLLALCRLWNIEIDQRRLADLGLGLGADVPVCLAGTPALMSGIGEIVVPLSGLPPCGILLVNPRVALSTAAVFRARTDRFSEPRLPNGNIIGDMADAAALGRFLSTYDNDLAEAAFRLAPEIRPTLQAIGSTPGCLLARLSGSGATCFGLYANVGMAEAAAARIAGDHPDWWIAPGRLRG